MNYVKEIQDFFDYITKYIQILIDYLNVNDLKNLLIYLFNCIPELVRVIIIFVLLLFILNGFIKAFRQ